MAEVLTFLLVRFAIIAVVVAVAGIVLFAIAVRLKRRGKWEQTRRRIGPLVSRAVDGYARRRGWPSELTRRAGKWDDR